MEKLQNRKKFEKSQFQKFRKNRQVRKEGGQNHKSRSRIPTNGKKKNVSGQSNIIKLLE